MPFSGFLLRNQTTPASQGDDDTKAPPRPHPQQPQGVVTEEPSARKLASSRQPPPLVSQVKKPKLSIAHSEVKRSPQHVEKQQHRGNLLLDNSEQSSGGELEWSDSDEGDLVMDTPSAAANLKKKAPPRKMKKKEVVVKNEEMCGGDDGGEGKGLSFT